MSESCPPREHLLLALLKPLPADERAALTAHLGACDRCRELFQAMRSLGYTEPHATSKPASTAACPSPERLDALVEPGSTGSDDTEVAAHVLACTHCQHALEAAMHRARAMRQEADHTTAAPISRGRARGLLVGALLAIVLVGVALVRLL